MYVGIYHHHYHNRYTLYYHDHVAHQYPRNPRLNQESRPREYLLYLLHQPQNSSSGGYHIISYHKNSIKRSRVRFTLKHRLTAVSSLPSTLIKTDCQRSNDFFAKKFHVEFHFITSVNGNVIRIGAIEPNIQLLCRQGTNEYL